eukprot:jgi/Phyca11/19748/fgenesh1_pg.PHYCAscaffold_51_\
MPSLQQKEDALAGGDWAALDSPQGFRIEDIAVEELVDKWERLVHDEPQQDDGLEQDDELQLDEGLQLGDVAQVDGGPPQDDYDMQLDDEGLCTAGPQGLDAYSTRHLHFHNGTSYHSAASSSQSSQPTRSPGNTNIHSIYEPSELGREYMQSLNMQNDLQQEVQVDPLELAR